MVRLYILNVKQYFNDKASEEHRLTWLNYFGFYLPPDMMSKGSFEASCLFIYIIFRGFGLTTYWILKAIAGYAYARSKLAFQLYR